MIISHYFYKGLIEKSYLIGFILFIFGTTLQGQKVTVEHQLKMLKMNLSEFSYDYNDSLIRIPSTIDYNQKIFLNDTIEIPNNIREKTTFHFEKKIILLTNSNNTFLFQIKKKFVEENKTGLIEHYYCTRNNKLYLISMVKDGVYIRKNNSYYSSFFYN